MTSGSTLRLVVLTLIGWVPAGCASSVPGRALDSPENRRYFPAAAAAENRSEYRIGPLDKISVSVFRVPDLSLQEAQVDASGQVLMPVIGRINVAGRTASQLSTDLTLRLAEFLQSPKVSVVVTESVAQRVTVEGSVNEAGVYNLRGPTTLLEAIAFAKGPSRVAALPNVAVFRVVDGKRMAAVFNLVAIREGRAEDPAIFGNDVVVVGLSNVKGAWREVVSTLPIFSVFQVIH